MIMVYCIHVCFDISDEIRQDIEDAVSHMKPWYVRVIDELNKLEQFL